VVLLASVLALVYVWRVVEVAYFRPYAGDEEAREAPWQLLVPTWALVGANLYFGMNAARTAQVAERAAEVLMTGLSP
jgi:multicomponent Na+:H+ antiporter subunit D